MVPVTGPLSGHEPKACAASVDDRRAVAIAVPQPVLEPMACAVDPNYRRTIVAAVWLPVILIFDQNASSASHRVGFPPDVSRRGPWPSLVR